MSLLNYWPSLDEISKCIKSEAENASDEVLLAVHQKFPLVYLKVGPDGKVMPERTVATEEELLSYFIGDAPSGSHVLPITGASGVGKSHLIRMLDARLHRLPDAHRYLVIRIPKSASLRKVVDLILQAEPLKNKKYDQIKEEFSKALSDISSIDDAVKRFQTELEIALNQRALELKESLRLDPTNSSLKERLGHAESLPKLMSDADTVNHFRLNVLPRIIKRAVKGGEYEEGEFKEVDDTSAEFNVADFDLGGVALGHANKQVANYYRFALGAQEGRGKVVAVDVLNDVVDQATSQLYKLNQSLGGMTLGEVILEIRRLLLADNRNLVILVEDFKALVGIQDTLAKVLIQEGETSKGKEYATIRSAIAVTDGYLAGKDTLATRAGREWVVESRLESEDETLGRTKSLVASYLNAARYGEEGLKKHYQQAFLDVGSSSMRWSPPVYSDVSEEDGKTLQAFGYVGEVPLFPFTEAAIESLANVTLTSGNALVFNPRFVIKNIILEILKVGREAFVNKQFPPPEITGKPASGEISQWLASLTVSDLHRERYRRLVTIWGGHGSQTRSDIGRIPREVFEAFSLPQPDIEYIPPKPKLTTSGENSNKTVAPEVASKQEQQIKAYQHALENWVQNGTKLESVIANSIRKALETLINQRIDWSAERCIKREFSKTQFSIYNAAGEGNLAANTIKVAPTSDDSDGRLRGELMALLRYFEVFKGNADYENVDDDIARIANLADRILPDALEINRRSIKLQNQSAILAMAANSRLLGVNERGRTVGGISAFLFGDADMIEVLPDSVTVPETFRNWRALQSSATQIRFQLRQLILDTSGCFQGATGKTVYGVDVVRLLEDYPGDEAVIEFANLAGITPELKQTLQTMSDARVSTRLNQVLQDARRIQRLIIADLGIDIDKQVVADAFKELAGTLCEMGVWSNADIGITPNVFVTLCEEFRSAAVKECLSILQGFEEAGGEEKSTAKKIARGANLPLIPLLTTERFLRVADKVIQAAETHAQDLESKYEGVNPSEKAQEIVGVFDDLVANLETLQKGGS